MRNSVKHIAFAFIIIFLGKLISQNVILADFLINQESIAQVECINKAKPELNCNGKCHLKETLTQDKKDNSDDIQNEASLWTLAFQNIRTIKCFPSFQIKKLIPPQVKSVLEKNSLDISEPPEVLLT